MRFLLLYKAYKTHTELGQHSVDRAKWHMVQENPIWFVRVSFSYQIKEIKSKFSLGKQIQKHQQNVIHDEDNEELGEEG